jgi:hypothetical protein
VIVLLVPVLASAQSFYNIRRDRTLIASAGLGVSSYFGDLRDPQKYLDSKFNLALGLQHYFAPRISARAELTFFQLQGADEKSNNEGRFARNLSFTSTNIEFNLQGTISLFPAGRRFYQRPVLNPYGFAGFGVLYFNPKAEYDGKKYALQPLQTEGVKYSKIAPVLVYGLGVKIKAGPFLNLALEGGYRTTFSDYLDDVSTVHPDKSSWDPNSIRYKLSDRRPELNLEPAATGGKRGDPSNNDGYFLFNIKAEYYLPHNFLFPNDQRRQYGQKRRSMRSRAR